jgi:GWxTD domain-containing protein
LRSQLVMVLALGFLSGGAARQVESDGIAVETVRFFRGDRTLVNGFVRVPHRLLAPLTVGPSGFAAFRLDVAVLDHAGTVLTRDGWSRQVGWGSTQAVGSASMESLAFALAPGDYTIRVTVRDSASGQAQSAETPVAAYAGRPGASDLLLAYSIRRGQPGDTAPAPGEVRKGDLFIAASADLRLSPTRAMVAYYCEVYRDSAATLPSHVQVVTPDGRALITTPPAQTPLAAGGGVLMGSLDLTGLPPGMYRLVLLAGAGGDTVTRAGAFRMGGFEAEQHVASAVQAEAEPTDPFARLSEPQMDTMFAPLIYLAPGSELSSYKSLTVEGKRRFLRDFWRRRDPTPERPENAQMAAFYAGIAAANKRFREGGGASIPGWRTDRGRIFLAHGEPDDVRREPSSGTSYPWEYWKYTKGRVLYYLFLDKTRLGNYSLVYTTDRRESSYPDWQSYFTSDALRDILNF